MKNAPAISLPQVRCETKFSISTADHQAACPSPVRIFLYSARSNCCRCTPGWNRLIRQVAHACSRLLLPHGFRASIVYDDLPPRQTDQISSSLLAGTLHHADRVIFVLEIRQSRAFGAGFQHNTSVASTARELFRIKSPSIWRIPSRDCAALMTTGPSTTGPKRGNPQKRKSSVRTFRLVIRVGLLNRQLLSFF